MKPPGTNSVPKIAHQSSTNVAASARCLFLASPPALRVPAPARGRLGFACQVLDLRAVALCGMHVEAEASRAMLSSRQALDIALGRSRPDFWCGIATFEPRLHRAPYMAKGVLAVHAARARVWGTGRSRDVRSHSHRTYSRRTRHPFREAPPPWGPPFM